MEGEKEVKDKKRVRETYGRGVSLERAKREVEGERKIIERLGVRQVRERRMLREK